jgi:23S rRNA (cytosine1962-C5)-methyltransferase
MPLDGYEPLDAGGRRRLERFGPVLIDRPAPTAIGPRRDADAWASAGARYDRTSGGWRLLAPLPEPWRVALPVAGIELELRPAAAGQVGLFPEQLPVWARLRAATMARVSRPAGDGAVSILNLFAYTGGATLACAAAGGTVAHVDAARTAVAWARSNAEASRLADAPIRWIVEDVPAFVARELRRGRRYDIVVLDPPSYGHAGSARAWQIDRDLEPLLGMLVGLLSPAPALVVLTAHSPTLSPTSLATMLGCFGDGTIDHGPLELAMTSGARLALGAFACWAPA